MWDTVLIVGAGGCTGRTVLDLIVSEKKAAKVVLTSRSGTLHGLPSSETVKIEVAALDMVDGAAEDLANLCEEVNPDIMFCCIGLKRYHIKAWGPSWPKIADHLLLACQTADVPLIFMDNMYAFGPEGMDNMPLRESGMDLTTSGVKTKPQVRALITRKFLAASEAGEAKLAIVRASDFFGPHCDNSILSMLWSDVMKKKTPTFLGNPKKVHAQTYVPDIARALILIAENPDTWGRAWHTPTQPDRVMTDWLRDIYRVVGRPRTGKLSYMCLDGFLMRALALAIDDVDGLRDVVFMWRGDYTVSSEDFKARFPDFEPTPLEDALQATNEWFASR
ncbi:Oxidoreductase HTATIP2 [Hondaea fermentalgiana]|uniref:Oxidoreductase HTATIP2 n=1 Tax=Hondaea fermentalgiana TaxID=2315210 RepID=A0A2R5GRE5_9STRA|nr:Oxidoreductase HTATIP2 [Hondaea fermentalgiana]|eukprot:GBG30454.1 Oxidoreductase HTATIP2 [Hondaea fermentalgiana]